MELVVSVRGIIAAILIVVACTESIENMMVGQHIAGVLILVDFLYASYTGISLH
jgi:hypothetical protein